MSNKLIATFELKNKYRDMYSFIVSMPESDYKGYGCGLRSMLKRINNIPFGMHVEPKYFDERYNTDLNRSIKTQDGFKKYLKENIYTRFCVPVDEDSLKIKRVIDED